MTTPDPTRSKAIEVMARAEASFEEISYAEYRQLFNEQAAHVLDALHAEGMAVVPGWQSIETKPRDHFPVLVWSEKLGQVVAFLDVTWAWWPCPAIEPLSSAPTHWRPLLPASPYGKASMQEGSAEARP